MCIEPDIVRIDAGPVTLGVPPVPQECSLQHPWVAMEVDVPAFGIARTAVTVREYLRFADTTGYPIDESLRTDERFKDVNAPAAWISWIDAVFYCQWLTCETGKHYRLPRDAEWEKAARGGLENKAYPWGDESPDGRADWNNGEGAPLPVGSFAPNGYGLHDIVGSMNVWCEERYDQLVIHDQASMCYDSTLLRDSRQNAVLRSGSFKSPDADILRCAFRHEDPIADRFDCIGFRLAMSV